MNKKEFALEAIKPYYKDPSLCGARRNREGVLISCAYLDANGNKCVFGKFMTEDALIRFRHESKTALPLLRENGEDILVPEARGILSPIEWRHLQAVHDAIAINDPSTTVNLAIEGAVKALGLFTMEELEA